MVYYLADQTETVFNALYGYTARFVLAILSGHSQLFSVRLRNLTWITQVFSVFFVITQ